MIIASSFTDAFMSVIDGTKTLGEAFKDMALSIISQIVRMQIQMIIFKAIMGIGTAAAMPDINPAVGGPVTYVAKGGVFERGNVIPFDKGGIVSSPTIFPMANGAGLMGEAGPEAVLPLTRGPSGNLGVESTGSGQPINITINAVDAQSFAELTRRNPAAIIGPVIEQINAGNIGFRDTLRKAVQ